MLAFLIFIILLIGVVLAIRMAMKRAATQRREHDARLAAMTHSYLAAMKKKQQVAQSAAQASAQPPAAPEAAPAREERECPFCAELILKKARVCKHCRRDVEPVA